MKITFGGPFGSELVRSRGAVGESKGESVEGVPEGSGNERGTGVPEGSGNERGAGVEGSGNGGLEGGLEEELKSVSTGSVGTINAATVAENKPHYSFTVSRRCDGHSGDRPQLTKTRI
jgi:hypothetical protein